LKLLHQGPVKSHLYSVCHIFSEVQQGFIALFWLFFSYELLSGLGFGESQSLDSNVSVGNVSYQGTTVEIMIF
jgi:hypothetical protein